LQDDEFMQRKEKAMKTVTDIFVSMLDFCDQEASGVSKEMVLVNAASPGFSHEKVPIKSHVELCS